MEFVCLFVNRSLKRQEMWHSRGEEECIQGFRAKAGTGETQM
jgi:hypothetical protein